MKKALFLTCIAMTQNVTLQASSCAAARASHVCEAPAAFLPVKVCLESLLKKGLSWTVRPELEEVLNQFGEEERLLLANTFFYISIRLFFL